MAELQFSVGDRVVYPGQGVCTVTAITEKVLAGERLTVVALAREEDSAQVLVPEAKIASVGVRKLAGKAEVESVFDYLKSASDDPELDWKVRHRSHQDKVALGGLMGLAEVVKSLEVLSELRPLPAKERERYDGARHLLVREIAAALELPEVSAEDAIDLALIPLGGAKKPRAAPVAPALGGDDMELGGDLGPIDLDNLGELEPEPEEAEPAEAQAAEPSNEGASHEEPPKPKKKAKAPKSSKPKPKKPTAAAKPKAKPAPKAKPKPAKKKK